MIEKLNKLTTEKQNDNSRNLDEKSTLETIQLMNNEDKKVAFAVEQVLPKIANVVDMVIDCFNKGGRLIYFGAGTSGRLGVLDAVECPPTFGTELEQVIGLMAGGKTAFVEAVEGAEDDEELGKSDLKQINLSNKDIVIGIAASGRTPYVVGGLYYAKSIGVATVALSCNEESLITKIADIAIVPVVGPEVLTGSTRLKAGTAQKMVLNMISTASMIGIGKVYDNLMVDVKPNNKKLVERAKMIVMMATKAPYEEVEEALQKSSYNSKVAIVMILLNCSYEEAVDKLEHANGFVNAAILIK